MHDLLEEIAARLQFWRPVYFGLGDTSLVEVGEAVVVAISFGRSVVLWPNNGSEAFGSAIEALTFARKKRRQLHIRESVLVQLVNVKWDKAWGTLLN